MNQQVLKYLQDHHQVQATTLARALIISKSKAAAALQELVSAGLAEQVNKKFFRARSANENPN